MLGGTVRKTPGFLAIKACVTFSSTEAPAPVPTIAISAPLAILSVELRRATPIISHEIKITLLIPPLLEFQHIILQTQKHPFLAPVAIREAEPSSQLENSALPVNLPPKGSTEVFSLNIHEVSNT
jgi:hypothetical protein